MYASPNFKTKKALKEAVIAYQELLSLGEEGFKAKYPETKLPKPVTFFQPGMGPPAPKDGTCAVEGPHYPEPHRWYATVTFKDGRAVSVK